jgi:acetyl esterase/lipase
VASRSAGGALAAATALAARDRGGPALAFQLLLVLALDDRCDLPSVDACTDGRIVDGRVVRGMWRRYLGSADADCYAALARAADLTGLPPAYAPTSRLARRATAAWTSAVAAALNSGEKRDN